MIYAHGIVTPHDPVADANVERRRTELRRLAVVELADVEGVLGRYKSVRISIYKNYWEESYVFVGGASEVRAPMSGRRLCDNFSHDISDSGQRVQGMNGRPGRSLERFR